MYAIKVKVRDPGAASWTFPEQKTMYGGKRIATGDTIFVFDSENHGGAGLLGRGVVTEARAVALKPGLARQTPRICITVKSTGIARCSLGRSELKSFRNWDDGRPETELNFKFYRQATDKLVGISDQTAAFLRSFF